MVLRLYSAHVCEFWSFDEKQKSINKVVTFLKKKKKTNNKNCLQYKTTGLNRDKPNDIL